MRRSTNGSSSEPCLVIGLAVAGCSNKMRSMPGSDPAGQQRIPNETRGQMNKDKYNLSFTSGGMCRRESVKLAELYLEHSDWSTVRDKVVAENLLQARTLNTLKRVCREVISRLKTLSRDELEYLVTGSHQEQAYLLWVAVCRRYRFIAEFAVEVLRERYITLKTDLAFEDFDTFFNRKSEWHLELDKISPTTKSKLRQVLFRMLKEADLLTSNNIINGAMLTPSMLQAIQQPGCRDLLYFPVFESELKGMSR